jgi:predicted DNA-binding transcriptional regulator AlpA
MRPLVAAKANGISPRTLWSLTKRGAIPHAKFGRVTIYPTAAILAWLEEITAHPPVQRPPAAGGDS